MGNSTRLLSRTVLAVLALTIALAGCASRESDSSIEDSSFTADSLDGLNRLSGAVSAEAPFAAAYVYARNLDKNVLYTVFTHKGQYRAINLMDGGYEILVRGKEICDRSIKCCAFRVALTCSWIWHCSQVRIIR